MHLAANCSPGRNRKLKYSQFIRMNALRLTLDKRRYQAEAQNVWLACSQHANGGKGDADGGCMNGSSDTVDTIIRFARDDSRGNLPDQAKAMPEFDWQQLSLEKVPMRVSRK